MVWVCDHCKHFNLDHMRVCANCEKERGIFNDIFPWLKR